MGSSTGRADVLLADHVDGEVRLNLGDAISGEGEATDVPYWGTPGFVSMPDAPDATGACQILYIVDGPRRIPIAGRDNRYSGKSGAPKPGDRMITSSGSARVMIKRADDAVTLYCENEPDNKSSMIITQNGKTGVTTILNGKSQVRVKTDEITFAAGGTTMTLDAEGLHVFGKHVALNTGSGNLGNLGPGAPPPGLGSIVAGPSGMLGAPSMRWTVAVLLCLAINVARWLWWLRVGGSPPVA